MGAEKAKVMFAKDFFYRCAVSALFILTVLESGVASGQTTGWDDVYDDGAFPGDIDWFWFHPTPNAPPPPQLQPRICDKANWATFSWHYNGVTDPSNTDLANRPTIRDFVHWKRRIQGIGGPCWAFAFATAVDIKYKIIHSLFDERIANGECGISVVKKEECYTTSTPSPHTSEESVLSLRTYFTNYNQSHGGLAHLDPRIFGRALSGLGSNGDSYIKSNGFTYIVFPRWWVTYNYRPRSNLAVLRKSVGDGVLDNGVLDPETFSTYTRFAHPSFQNYRSYLDYLHNVQVSVPYSNLRGAGTICGGVTTEECYEKVKQALACGTHSDDPTDSYGGPLLSSVYAHNDYARNGGGVNHGQLVIGWVDKHLPNSTLENPMFADAWSKIIQKSNWTYPLLSSAGEHSGKVLVFDSDEMREAASGVLVGFDFSSTPYFVPVITRTLKATHAKKHGVTYTIDEALCDLYIEKGSTKLCTWHSDEEACYCKFSFLHHFVSVSMDYSQYYPDPEVDTDGDGSPDYADNCPSENNPAQSDIDGDGAGDVCDPDADGDGVIAELDGDDLNFYIGTDLNGNDLWEISFPRIHKADPAYIRERPANYITENNPDVFSDRALGAGYQIVWSEDDIYLDNDSFPSFSGFQNWFIAKCVEECRHHTHASDLTACEEKCYNIELFNSPPYSNPPAYPGEYSFACVYENYFHPKCLRWVYMLSILEKMWTQAKSDNANIDIVRDYLFGEMEPVISDVFGRAAKLMEIGPNPNISNFANLTIENLRAYLPQLTNPTHDTKYTSFHMEMIAALEDLLAYYPDTTVANYTETAILDVPSLLANINPCDAVHQANLWTFSEMKSGITAYCQYSTSSEVERILCENEQLIFWKSFDDVEAATDAQLPPEISSLPVLSQWIGEMESLCEVSGEVLTLDTRAHQTSEWGVGGVGAGGMVQTYITQGIHVGFSTRLQRWSGNSWTSVDVSPTVSRIKVAGCPCVGEYFSMGLCGDRCEKSSTPHHRADTEETWRNGNYFNQAWDPLHSDKVASPAYTGIDPKWVATFGGNYDQEGRKYFKEKTVPSNTTGGIFFQPREFRDYDKALHDGVLPTSSPLYELMPDLATGEFTSRISRQLNDTIDGQEVTIHRAYSPPTPIDENAYAGTLHGAFVVNWNQSEIWIIPGIAEQGVWGNPISPWTVGDFGLLKDDQNIYLLTLRAGSRVSEMTQLPLPLHTSQIAVVDTTRFKGLVAVSETASGGLESVVLHDGRSGAETTIAGALAGLKETVLLPLKDQVVVAGVRTGSLRVYALSFSGEISLKGEFPFVSHVTRIAGCNDRLLAEVWPVALSLRVSQRGVQTEGVVVAPGRVRSAARTGQGYLYTSGRLVLGVDREFSFTSLRLLRKRGLPTRNLRGYTAISSERPTLLGADKNLYTYDESTARWRGRPFMGRRAE